MILLSSIWSIPPNSFSHAAFKYCPHTDWTMNKPLTPDPSCFSLSLFHDALPRIKALFGVFSSIFPPPPLHTFSLYGSLCSHTEVPLPFMRASLFHNQFSVINREGSLSLNDVDNGASVQTLHSRRDPLRTFPEFSTPTFSVFKIRGLTPS